MDISAPAPTPLSLLLELGQAFHSALELDPLLVSILKQLQSTVRSESGSIWLLNEAQSELKCTHAIGPAAEQIVGRSISAERFLPAYRAVAGQTIKIDDAAQSHWSTEYPDYFRPGTRNIIIAPLVARGELLGTINMNNKLGQAIFSLEDHELLVALAGHA